MKRKTEKDNKNNISPSVCAVYLSCKTEVPKMPPLLPVCFPAHSDSQILHWSADRVLPVENPNKKYEGKKKY
jgi:hypothetical protein